MAEKDFEEKILKAFDGRRKTAPEIAAEVGRPDGEVEDTLSELVEEGAISQEADFFFVTDEHGVSHSGLTDLEWNIIRFLRGQKGKAARVGPTALSVTTCDVEAALSRLKAMGIVVADNHGGYKITSQSELLIPLSSEERAELQEAEKQIDALVSEICPRQLDVAKELRLIRDRKLYRETHKRFQDYVSDRFERSRDWAYKIVRDLEVAEALREGQPEATVEALLQTVSAREIPHLARLKKHPEKMWEALEVADEKAQTEGKARTVDHVKAAVIEVATGKKSESETPPEPKRKKTRTVRFTGIDHDAGETADLPAYFVEFGRWLRKHPTESAFTIEVGAAN
jgi:hypothetical protein